MRCAIAAALCACAAPPGAGVDGGVDGPPGDAPPPAKLIAYVSGAGPDIAWFDVAADGKLTAVGRVASFAANPSFLAVDPGATTLYAVSSNANRVGAYAIDRATGALTFINDVAAGGTGPTHLTVDRGGKYVLVASYGDGSIAVFPIGAGGRIGAAQQTLDPGANAHMIVQDPSSAYVVVPCLGSDHVSQYLFDPATGALTANAVPVVTTANGAGPRHIAFTPSGTYAYLINERDSTMTAFAFDRATGQLAPRQTLTTRAAGATGTNTTAEVWVHPSGRFVYGSNRGDDNIVQYAIDAGTGMMTLVGHVKTGGMTPRDFTLDPAGKFLYAANQNSGNVVVFAIDAATGRITPTGATITAQTPTFVGIVALPAR